MENALKYNEHDMKEIFISISKVKKENKSYVKIEFIDNGKGIPDSIKESLFKFENEDFSKSTRIGFGLLFIREIISNLKEQIQVKDKIQGNHNKGSNFQLLIQGNI